MTYKEWITKTVGKFQLSADDVDLILCNQSGLIPDPDAPVDVRKAKTAICREFTTLIPLPISEKAGIPLVGIGTLSNFGITRLARN